MGSCLGFVGLALLFLIGVCEGCLREERTALLLIKESLNNPTGSALPDWVGDDCCSWSGVTCDGSPPQVIQILVADKRKKDQGGWYPNATLFSQFKALEEIDLSGTQFRGWVMPQGLNQLKTLQSLTMKDNQLDDAPWVNNLTSLTYIDLSNNELAGASFLSGLNQLKTLQALTMKDNQLDDASWVNNLTSLTYIDLSNNELTGASFLSGICEMQLLEYLDLSENEIQGTISPCLGNLTSMQNIFLSKNHFSGKLSFSNIANLSDLTFLELSSNHDLQVETESPSWSASFQLGRLYLGNCILNKQSGGRIPSFLSGQQYLRRLDLANSSLMGEIPAFLIYNNSLDALRLKQNELVGSFPIPHQNITSNLRFLDISRNNISKSLFRDVGSHFPNLKHVNMSANNLQGMIPPSLGNIAILWVLDLSYNNFSGEMPDMLTSNTSLRFLILSNNKLHGKVLPKSSNMPQLEMLDLHDNLLSGVMPQNLLNSPLLKLLDVRSNFLMGAIPSWLHRLRELVALFLGRNSFHGSIPIEFCQLRKLHILDLSHNCLSGAIPRCLNGITSLKNGSSVQIKIPDEGNKTFEKSYISFDFTTKGLSYSYKGIPFTLMTGIDFSKNQLSGNIPDEIGELAALRSLNLSHNLLAGPFPTSFQNLINLESLDLSHNELVGAIPPGMVKLNYLSVFSVAYNNLSGCLPTTRQFSTFTATSYEGNPGLRGDSLGSNCSKVENPSQPHTKGGEVKMIDSEWSYRVFIAISYTIGACGVFITLAVNKQWRKAYFDAVDAHLDARVRRIMAYFRSKV